MKRNNENIQFFIVQNQNQFLLKLLPLANDFMDVRIT